MHGPLFFLMVLSACSKGTSDDTKSKNSASDSGTVPENRVVMETSLGSITLSLDLEHAPITSANFLSYVDEGFFDGSDGKGATIFHRVILGFMDQGGGLTADGASKKTHDPIALEDSGLSNLRGTIAMARTSDPDSATSQFFLNTVDNTFLDSTARTPGYAVFGTITEGLETIDAIAEVATDASDRPKEDVVITACAR